MAATKRMGQYSAEGGSDNRGKGGGRGERGRWEAQEARRLDQIWAPGPDPDSNAPLACHNGNCPRADPALIGAFQGPSPVRDIVPNAPLDELDCLSILGRHQSVRGPSDHNAIR